MHVRGLRKKIVPTLGSGLLLAIPALAQAQPPRGAPVFTEAPSKVCPLDVPRTLVVERGFEGGSALIFVTRGPLELLRSRARALAELHNRQLERGRDTSEFTGEASVQSIDRGVVITFQSPGEGLAPAGSTSALVHAQELAGQDCPFLRDEGVEEEAKRPPTSTQVPMPGATVPNMSPSVPTPVVGGAPPVISF